MGDPDAVSGIGYWKRNLHYLQESAPKPKPIACSTDVIENPIHYGSEYHGCISREEAEKLLLGAGIGAFLVRASRRCPIAFTLSMNFDNNVLNYKLYYDEKRAKHFVGEKRFDSMVELVQDGLICMFVEKHASEYIAKMAEDAAAHYDLTPYSIYGSYAASANSASKKQPRCHNWNYWTFKRPTYCDFCRNFLWGLVQQGLRCKDCGFSAHKRCSEKTHHDCLPGAKYVKRCFAVDLEAFCLAHSCDVPPVVTKCVSDIERRGLLVEGVYRVSGSHERMERMRQRFDLNQPQMEPNLQQEDVHDVAGLLKLYLRLLPQQLVPFSTYSSLLNNFLANRENSERIRNCRQILKTDLSPFHYQTLRSVLMHLRKVSEYSAENKMTPENLSMIFSPTIFCTGTRDFPPVPNQQHLLLNFLIVTKNIIGAPG